MTTVPFTFAWPLRLPGSPPVHRLQTGLISKPLSAKLKAATDGGAVAVRRNAEDPPPPPMTTTTTHEPSRRSRSTPPDQSLQEKASPPTRRSSSGPSRRSCDPTPQPNGNARRGTTDLDVIIDGHSVTALVDTGTDYSVITGPFAVKLKMVKTAWEGPDIRTAGGHLITPTGTCMARVTIHSQTYSVSFVVLQQCSRDVILGMDFLEQHGAVIDLRFRSVTLCTDNARHPTATSLIMP